VVKFKFADILKSFDVPGVVSLQYTQDGVQMLSKVKAGATAFYCPSCGGMTPTLQATARGLCCKVCAMRARRTFQDALAAEGDPDAA